MNAIFFRLRAQNPRFLGDFATRFSQYAPAAPQGRATRTPIKKTARPGGPVLRTTSPGAFESLSSPSSFP